ncbi:DUF1003 domain-containing protein [Naasia lichenicola]|uniref:DUF1003 domain-containing protein n=1 Tax=Naasia lichenicola TaxID=2565933 RepID=A0A4S4FHH9_9MICO|nr:DUF1003 domain-containing protein [Naasia lichenicola]THG28486.1 DUF1003 domain-containing protein [Naasia lichenicola]
MARPTDTRSRSSRGPRLDAPKGLRTSMLGSRSNRPSRDRFGRFTEFIARAMGTPWFLLGLTLFCIAWIAFNSFAPDRVRFDDAALGFTALTLVLSLQASYAAPLILLAQNRQDDRERVQIEQDRQRSERNLSDTEYLAREVVALRLLVKDMASKDFIRAELRSLLEDLEKRDSGSGDERADRGGDQRTGDRVAKGSRTA